jgi:DNA (cytosine-5)-methyltransferase 1
VVYYNEIDPFCCQWLRNLIEAGLIARGEVDERDIRDVTSSDLCGFTQCHWFAGIGGWSYALRLAGWPDDRPAWTGSCPCQPFSAAGKGAGFADERHLWPAWFHLISACCPPVVFGEQVSSPIALKWLDVVVMNFEEIGYDFAAADLCASGVGAPHIRQRLYWVAENLHVVQAGKAVQRLSEVQWQMPGRTASNL